MLGLESHSLLSKLVYSRPSERVGKRLGKNLNWFTCEIQTCIYPQASRSWLQAYWYSRKKNNKKALECEGGFYTNFKCPSLFYFTTSQYITFIQEIKDSASEELKLHISLSFILLGTSVKGILTIIQFQGQGMFQCQERRALNLGEKGAGPERSVAGLWPLPQPCLSSGPRSA